MRLPLALLCSMLLHAASAQDIRDELMRTYSLHAGPLRLRVDARNRLVVDHLANDRRTRQDIAPLGHLDPASISWSEHEGVIVMHCLPGRQQCMSTEEFDRGIIRRTSRNTLPAPAGDRHGQRTIATLQTLVRNVHEQLVDAPIGTP